MTLTEEQKERIRKNRERALEIQKQRRLQQQQHGKEKEKEENRKRQDDKSNNLIGNDHQTVKRQKLGTEKKNENSNNKKANDKNLNDNDDDDDIILEDFEIGASDLVSKQEAKKMYCLPEGTLAVCSYVEKPNPHHKSWTPMKLYKRKEIRQRARKRYGGLEGLQKERKQREEKQFQKDMQTTKNIFK